MTKKVLVIGASGFLGTQFYHDFSTTYTVVGTYYHHHDPAFIFLDITDNDAVENFLTEVQPDIIVHPAAQPWVDFCEQNSDISYAINVAGPKSVIEWCARHNKFYVFLSSDYVFDGTTGPYTEEAPVAPLNIYGKHKALVEQYIRATCPITGLIVRTVGVYGWEKQGKNFVARLVQDLRQGKEVFIPEDQYGTPVHVADLSHAILQLVQKKRVGIYHVAGPLSLSRYAFALLIAGVFDCDRSLIKGVPTSMLKQVAQRPKKGGLLITKITKELGVTLRAPEIGLMAMKKQEHSSL